MREWVRRANISKAAWLGLAAGLVCSCGSLPGNSSASVDGDLPSGPGVSTTAGSPSSPTVNTASNATATSTAGTASTANPSSTFDNVEVVDRSLAGKLAITRAGSQPGENGLLTVFAGLKNKTGKRLHLEVETIYRDSLGHDLNAESWIPVTLQPHEDRDYSSASISAQATDFLVRVRRPAKGGATHGG
jgi:hypothetical protein